MTRNDRHLTVDDLKARIEAGEIDTVVVAFTDMQGRLQGKRLHGHYFVDFVLGHGTEGCNYLLGRRHRHEHGRRLRDHLVGPRLRRHGVRARPRDDPGPHAPAGDGDGAVRPRLARPHAGRPVPAQHPQGAAAARRRSRLRRRRRHRAGVHRLRGHLRGRPRPANYTRPDARPTSTTSTTPSSAPPGSSRCCATSATRCTPPASTSRAPRASATSASTRSASSTTTCWSPRTTMRSTRRSPRRSPPMHGKSLTFMAKFNEREGNSCHIHLSLRGEDGDIVFWDDDGRQAVAAVRQLRRRRARDDGGLHAALRAEHQLLQAVRRRLVRADGDRLG